MLTGKTCNALGNLVRILMGNPMGALKESHQTQVGHKAVEILDAAGQQGVVLQAPENQGGHAHNQGFGIVNAFARGRRKCRR